MDITEERHGGTVVVAPLGRIDSTTATALDRHLAGLDAQGQHRVVVDLDGVDYISSAGLRVMLTLAKRVRARQGGLAICGLNQSVRQVFELAGFLPLFVVEGSRPAAVQAVAPR